MDSTGSPNNSDDKAAPTNQDELIMAQKEAIDKEIANNSLHVSQEQPLSVLELEFANDAMFCEKVKNLGKTYKGFRRTRPDGNCFYRALGFRYFEILLSDKDAWQKFRDAVAPSKDQMFKLGFPQFTVEDFYDHFMEHVDKLGEPIAPNALFETFNDQGTSDYLIVFLRLLTSMQLKKDCDFYQNFMEGGLTVDEFCNREVEPMYHESDHIHIIALTAATGINVRIQYLDRGDHKEASPHDFPEGSQPAVHLLYRPGHYDILYPRAE